jgi:hypothetical protein
MWCTAAFSGNGNTYTASITSAVGFWNVWVTAPCTITPLTWMTTSVSSMGRGTSPPAVRRRRSPARTSSREMVRGAAMLSASALSPVCAAASLMGAVIAQSARARNRVIMVHLLGVGIGGYSTSQRHEPCQALGALRRRIRGSEDESVSRETRARVTGDTRDGVRGVRRGAREVSWARAATACSVRIMRTRYPSSGNLTTSTDMDIQSGVRSAEPPRLRDIRAQYERSSRVLWRIRYAV